MKRKEIILPEIPPNKFLIKKISINEVEKFVLKVSLPALPDMFDKPTRKYPTDVYSAWELPVDGAKYRSYTMLNDLLVGQVGTKIIDGEDEPANRSQESIDVIYAASEHAKKGKQHGYYLQVENKGN